MPFPRHISHCGNSLTYRCSVVWYEITEMTQGPPKRRHSLGAYLAWVPFQIFPYAIAQSLGSGSHIWRFYSQCRHISLSCSTWGMEIPTRVKVKGSPWVAHSLFTSRLPIYCHVCTLSSLLLPPQKWNQRPPHIPGGPGAVSWWSSLCPIMVQDILSTHLHIYSKITFPFSYSFFAAESKVGLWFTFLQNSLYSFELTF